MRWDLLIIGGGPAGCAAALRARQSGLRVVLIERTAVHRRHPGETLHPGLEAVFAQLGVLDRVLAAGFYRHSGVWVEWDGPRTFQAYGSDERGAWQGFQAERARLDALLLEAVQDSGATVLRPHRATGLLFDGKRVAGIATDAGAIRACLTADAGGRQSWLARRLGLRDEQHSPPLAVRFGWTHEFCTELDGQPLLRACRGGWDWRAPLGGERVAWVELRVMPGQGTPMPSGGSAAHPKFAVGAKLLWRLFPECAGPGYFLLGDAAASLDPSSSHGVLRALMSGILASHLLTAVHCGSLTEDAANYTYRDWVRGQFYHDVMALRRLWESHPCEQSRAAMTRGLRSLAQTHHERSTIGAIKGVPQDRRAFVTPHTGGMPP